MKGRRRVLARRARNGEFLDCVTNYATGELILSTRRGFRATVKLIGFVAFNLQNIPVQK